MKVALRADASTAMGIGHLMRCLTLAEALRARGAEVHFICRQHPGHLIELLRGRSLAVSALPEPRPGPPVRGTAHAAWLGVPQTEDAAQSVAALGRLRPDWLVVDHYGLDAVWERLLQPHVGALMVIDDLADRRHEGDLLLDQNLGRSAQDYHDLAAPDCRLLIGPRHALLRPEFAATRAAALRRRPAASAAHLLVTMGGTDAPDVTSRVLAALQRCALPPQCRITVVMGPQAPWIERVRQRAAAMPWPTEVLVGSNRMAQLMADADLAIAAAGGTSWERCCLALPTLLVELAANQATAAQALQAASAARRLSLDDLDGALERQFADAAGLQAWLASAAAAAAALCDGGGCARVVDAMLGVLETCA